MTFLGVFVTCGAFYSRVCLGAGDSPPFGLQGGLERHSFVISIIIDGWYEDTSPPYTHSGPRK